MSKVTVFLSAGFQKVRTDKFVPELEKVLKEKSGLNISVEISSSILGQPDVSLNMIDMGGYSGTKADEIMVDAKKVVYKYFGHVKVSAYMSGTICLPA